MYQSPEQTWDPSDMCGTLSTFEVDDWTTTRFVYAESYSRCSDHYKIVSPVLPLDIFEPQPIPRDQEQSIEAVLPDEIHQLLTDLEELPVDEIIANRNSASSALPQECTGVQINIPDRQSTSASDIILDVDNENFDLAEYLFKESPTNEPPTKNVAPPNKQLETDKETSSSEFGKVKKTPLVAHRRATSAGKRLDLNAQKYVVQTNYCKSESRTDEDDLEVDVETVVEVKHDCSTLISLDVASEMPHKKSEAEKLPPPKQNTNAAKSAPVSRSSTSTNKSSKMVTACKTKAAVLRKVFNFSKRTHEETSELNNAVKRLKLATGRISVDKPVVMSRVTQLIDPLPLKPRKALNSSISRKNKSPRSASCTVTKPSTKPESNQSKDIDAGKPSCSSQFTSSFLMTTSNLNAIRLSHVRRDHNYAVLLN